MSEYKKTFITAAIGAFAGALVTILVNFTSRAWDINDIEYKRGTKDAYLSSRLGDQGFSMALGGKPIKNVSVVEFSIINRTDKQVAGVELLFSVDGKEKPNLVFSKLFAPDGLSTTELIESLPVKEPTSSKFLIKALPPQKKESERLYGMFIFEGDHAPEMSVVSTSNTISVIPYKESRDTIRLYSLSLAILVTITIAFLILMHLLNGIAFVVEYKHRVSRFLARAKTLQAQGKLQSKDPLSFSDAEFIYRDFSRPHQNHRWENWLFKKWGYEDILNRPGSATGPNPSEASHIAPTAESDNAGRAYADSSTTASPES